MLKQPQPSQKPVCNHEQVPPAQRLEGGLRTAAQAPSPPAGAGGGRGKERQEWGCPVLSFALRSLTPHAQTLGKEIRDGPAAAAHTPCDTGSAPRQGRGRTPKGPQQPRAPPLPASASPARGARPGAHSPKQVRGP